MGHRPRTSGTTAIERAPTIPWTVDAFHPPRGGCCVPRTPGAITYLFLPLFDLRNPLYRNIVCVRLRADSSAGSALRTVRSAGFCPIVEAGVAQAFVDVVLPLPFTV